jgi:membrane peptidoglycan carboxypeptidase
LYNSGMPAAAYLIQKRERRRQKQRRNPMARTGLGLSVLLSLSLFGAVIWLSTAYTALVRDLPSIEYIPALLEPPGGMLLHPTRLYDRSGSHLISALENPAAEGREYLYVPANWTKSSLADHEKGPIPFTASPTEALVNATLAALDPDFWDHPGFQLGSLGGGEQKSLAQRLADSLLLWDEPAEARRSLRERLLAVQLTEHYGRPRVLEWSLNNLQYGHLIYGADAAARVYFGKSARNLTLAESAVLAAVSESPSLNPFTAPEIAREKQQKVLAKMLTLGLITQKEMQEALLEKVVFRQPSAPAENPAPAFTRLAIEQLAQRINIERIERGGLILLTTLDEDLQNQLNCTAAEELSRLKEGLTARSFSADDTCAAARLLPTLPFSGEATFPDLAAHAIILSPQSGQIFALTGDSQAGLDPTRLPGHPPGSLLTPFIYLTAFTRGFSPASLVWDIPGDEAEGALSEQKFHGPVRLRTAFANDYLIPASQVLSQVGPENVLRTARQMGFSSVSLDLISGLSSEPGGWNRGEVTLLEAVQAFGVFANQGTRAGAAGGTGENSQPALEAVTLLKVSDRDGHTWLDCQDSLLLCPLQARPVVSPQLAYLVTHVLSDETARWPSLGHPNPLEIGRPAAVKLGRTGGSGGAWAVGYTPQLVSGVWIGPRSRDAQAAALPEQEEKTITNAAAAVWHAITQYASQDLPPLGWSAPAGVSQVEVCDPSGLLPTSLCPRSAIEVFLEGTEPVHGDNLFRVFSVNRETGRLATIFTPPALVEEKVYLVLPAFAASWGENSGLPLPPKDYDSIYAPPSISTNALISSPQMFSHRGGQVKIEGSAQGSGFSFYRLQVGKGLNPREWIQIGEDACKAGQERGSGVLGHGGTERAVCAAPDGGWQRPAGGDCRGAGHAG